MKKVISIMCGILVVCLIGALGLLIGLSAKSNGDKGEAVSIKEMYVDMPNDVDTRSYSYTPSELNLTPEEEERFVALYNACYNIIDKLDMSENEKQRFLSDDAMISHDFSYNEIKDQSLVFQFKFNLSWKSILLKNSSEMGKEVSEIGFHNGHETISDGEIILPYTSYIAEYYRTCCENILPNKTMIKSVLACTSLSDEALGNFLFRNITFYHEGNQTINELIMEEVGIWSKPTQDYQITVYSNDEARTPINYTVIGYYMNNAFKEKQATSKNALTATGKDYYTLEYAQTILSGSKSFPLYTSFCNLG